jgi:hypothetical protein
MGWLSKIFICGRGIPRSNKVKRDAKSGITDTGLVSEITQAGDYETGEFEHDDIEKPVFKIADNCIRILARKKEGEKLGIRLMPRTVDIHSFERDSPLGKFSNEIPVGSSICDINGVVPNTDTIRSLLRECRPLSTVVLVLRVKTTPPSVGASRSFFQTQEGLNPPPAGQRNGSSRFSHSSTSSVGYSPTPSQLSTLWRRVSESGALEPTLTLPQATAEGVTPIDFDRLARNSMSMWTRSGRGSLPTPSSRLPDQSIDEEIPYRHYLEEETFA